MMTEPPETEQTTVYRDPLDVIVRYGGKVTYVDDSGAPRTVIGSQPDGTITVADSNAPAPPSPSAPTLTPIFAGLAVAWDGMLASDTPLDFDHVEVHVNDTNGFTPSAATLYGILRKKGTLQAAPLTVGETYYTVLIAVNSSGNSSAASSQVSGVPSGIDGADLTDGSIGAAKVGFDARDIGGVNTTISGTAPTGAILADIWIDSAHGFTVNRYDGTTWVAVQFGTQAIQANSITGALIAATTIVAGNMAANSISTSALQANAVTASKLAAQIVLATTIIAGTAAGARVQLDSTGILMFDASGAQRGQFGSDGSVWLDGDFLSATELFGQSLELNCSANQGLFVYGSSGTILNPNPDFVSGIANWSATATVLAYSSDHQVGGHNTLKITRAGGAATVLNDAFTVTPGSLYQLHASLWATSGEFAYVALEWQNSSGAVIKVDSSGPNIMSSAWEDTYAQGVAPVGATKCQVQIGQQTTYADALYIGFAEVTLTNIGMSFVPVATTDKYGNAVPAGLKAPAVHCTSITPGNLTSGVVGGTAATSGSGRLSFTNPFNSASAKFALGAGNQNQLYGYQIISVSSTTVTIQVVNTSSGANAAGGQDASCQWIGMLNVA